MIIPSTNFMYVIAGLNGAGKTTFVRPIIEENPQISFVNPDIVQAKDTISATDAGYMCLDTMKKTLIPSHKSFLVETTLSGQYNFLKLAHDNGYIIKCVYISLPSADEGDKRVAQRRTEGGHYVEPEVVHRRYIRSLGHLPMYLPLFKEWEIYDHSKRGEYRLVAKGVCNQEIDIVNEELYRTWVQNCVEIVTNNLSKIGSKTQIKKCLDAMRGGILIPEQYKIRVSQLLVSLNH